MGEPGAQINRNRKQKKMKDAKKYRAIYRMDCRTGCRSSEKFWSMEVVLQSHGETLRLRIKTLIRRQEVGIPGILHGLTIRDFFSDRTSVGWPGDKLPDN